MRLVYYGRYGNALIRRQYRQKTIAGLNKKVGDAIVNEKFITFSLGKFSREFSLGDFSGGLSEFPKNKGVKISLRVGAAISALLYVIFFL